MNPVTSVSWLWRAWRGRSVTFAALFALGVLGVSAMGMLRHGLRQLGAPWYLWLFVPVVIVTVLARKEADWMPDPERRRRWAWGLVLGSILVAIVAAKFAPSKLRAEAESPRHEERVPGRSGQAVPHGR